jgi:hypothetical protein
MASTENTASLLTYAGAIPFVAIAVLAASGLDHAIPFDARQAALVYGALIVSFLSGIHWHIALTPVESPRHLLVLTNAFALAAWGIVFVEPASAAWLLFATLFALLLLVDRLLFGVGLLPSWFYRLRIRISVIVIASLLVAGYSDAVRHGG